MAGFNLDQIHQIIADYEARQDETSDAYCQRVGVASWRLYKWRQSYAPALPTVEGIPISHLSPNLINAELARRSLKQFVKQGWGVVDPSPFIGGYHVDAICEHLEACATRQIRRLIINIPPRHGKSLLTSVHFPAWVWVNNPSERFLCASYSAHLSIRDNVKSRDLIRSDWYQARWGHLFKLKDDQDQKARYANDKGGQRVATSPSGTATGEGGSYLMVDDPSNVEQALSDDVRRSTLDWWDTTMSSRLDNPKTGIQIVIQQRVHERDLTGHLLAQGGWEHLVLPAEYEAKRSKVTCIGWKDPRTEEGQLLAPERFGPVELAELKKRLGSFATAGQLQQRPVPAGGGLIKVNWFRRFKKADVEEMAFDDYLISADLSFKGGDKSDFVVIQAWGMRKAEYFLLDQTRFQADFPETLTRFVTFTQKWPQIVTKIVESRANGPALIASLRSKISGIIGYEPKDSKEARASAVSPLIEAGNVYIPDPDEVPWVKDYLAEIGSFPRGAHDDQTDATSQALIRLRSSSSNKAVWLQHAIV